MSDPFIGQIMMFGGNFTIRNWGQCSGGLIAISSNNALFSILGTMYGGDGRTTFALPDFRGRVPMSKGRHPGSLYDWRQGQAAGTETHTLNLLELAAHSHTVTLTGTTAGETITPTATLFTEKGAASVNTPTGNLLANDSNGNIYKAPDGTKTNNAMSSEAIVVDDIVVSPQAVTSSGSTNITGNSQSFNIIQPTLAVNFLIAMFGIYPSRN